MSISDDEQDKIDQLGKRLISMSAAEIELKVKQGDILKEPSFQLWGEGKFAAFYAPFDWINEEADIILLGITPGRSQATKALLALRSALMAGKSVPEASGRAKQAASFEGDMRAIAGELMDYFRLNEVLGLQSCSMLFGAAAHRAHYTSVLRYPVLEWKATNKKGTKVTGWTDYGGDEKITKRASMLETIETKLVPELRLFPNAWLVPFGPVPALVLDQLVDRGDIERSRILAGLNHPSGTQWNRHNCQLNRVDHKDCSRNVGCSTIQERSRQLRDRIYAILNGSQDTAAGRLVS